MLAHTNHVFGTDILAESHEVCSFSPQRRSALIHVKRHVAFISNTEARSGVVSHCGHTPSYSILPELSLITVSQAHPLLLLSEYLHTHECSRCKNAINDGQFFS